MIRTTGGAAIRVRWFVSAAIVATVSSFAVAEDEPLDAKSLVKAELLADVDAILPGETFTLAIRFTMKPHWHIYWINPGETGMPTSVALELPEGFKAGPLQWPVPQKFVADEFTSYGYEDEAVLLVDVTAPAALKAGETITIGAKAEWLSCKVACIPGDAAMTLSLAVGDRANKVNAKVFDAAGMRMPTNPNDLGVAKIVQEPIPYDKQGFTMHTVIFSPGAAPSQVEWYPATGAALEMTDVQYKVNVYQPDNLPAEGYVRSLFVVTDDAGVRRGFWAPVFVTKPSRD